MALLAGGCDGTSPSPDGGSDDAQVAPACPTGTTECGERCVDTSNDRQSCGACDNACAAGEACVDGACSILCPAGQTQCDGACVDVDTDRRHCGACGSACGAGEICTDGACEVSCPSGQTLCGGVCADTNSDPLHCGGCGVACDGGEVCSAGTCAASCGAGLTDCGGACVDTANDPGHCGGCDTACAAPTGASGLCMAGSCRAVCDALAGDCNGDLSSASSDGCETPLGTDPANCGVCNAVCALTNATAGCDAGGCVIAACDAGFEDCDGADANGCESELAMDDANCGACGNACAAGSRCSGGSCVVIVGEDCSNAFALSNGANTVLWTAVAADYVTSNPSCVSTSYSMQGPDVVLSYSAASDQRVTLELEKPTNTRWAAVVSTEACGTISPSLACISDYGPTTMSGSFQLAAGETAYVYVRDTSSGSLPLDNPLNVNVTAVDCSASPPVTLDPPNGSTTTQLSATFTATFGAPVIGTSGTVTITGNMGTSLSYDLSTLPSEVSFGSGNTVMTIDPGISFPPGEALTLSWSGLQSVVCTTPVAVPPPTWGVNVIVPPCTPGAGGLVGTTLARTPTGLSSVTEYYVAADGSPTGYVYFGGTASLYRIPKSGGTLENVYSAAGLGTTNVGYAMLVDGLNIYTVDSTTSGTTGHLFRISSDGGATWSVQDYASFPTTPGDDFRAVTAHGGRIYLVTEEDSAGTATEIWSVDASATTLPAMATLELSFTDEGDCSAIARDGSFYYLLCDDGGDRLVRIPVAGGASQLITDTISVNATNNVLYGDDTDGDGVFDVLYAQSYYERIDFVCSPTSATPYTDRLAGFGDGTSNYGMGFDATNNVLYMIDDDNREIVSVQ